MATKICGKNVSVFDAVALKYPVHGTRNVLKSRVGIVEHIGESPKGTYITCKLDTGEYRNFQEGRIVDLNIVTTQR